MGKESILLLCILKLLTDVNNTADTIVSILLRDRWESHSHEQQQERLNLILLATVHSPSRDASDSTWQYLTAKWQKPIGFRVCGFHINSSYVLLTAATMVISAVWTIIESAL